jgi:hypothetical protein
VVEVSHVDVGEYGPGADGRAGGLHGRTGAGQSPVRRACGYGAAAAGDLRLFQLAAGGRWSARFYSINSLGAVFGAGVAGFYLVQGLGMVASVQLTALVNVLIGFTAVGLARRLGDVAKTARPAAPSRGPADLAPGAFRWSCGLVALTGGVSMGLEVLASRSLVLIFGASLQFW